MSSTKWKQQEDISTTNSKEQSPSEDDPLHIESERGEPLVNPGIAGHNWKQNGPYLVCDGCKVKHAQYIGVDRFLTGFDNGIPILKTLKDVLGR